QHGPVLDEDPLAQPAAGVHHGAGADRATGADDRAGVDDGPGAEGHPVAQWRVGGHERPVGAGRGRAGHGHRATASVPSAATTRSPAWPSPYTGGGAAAGGSRSKAAATPARERSARTLQHS